MAVTLEVTKPSDDADDESGSGAARIVPDVVCINLQDAQDRLQAAGFFDLRSEDALGRGRWQVIDRNWVVTDQSPEPGGRRPSGTTIVLTTVKYGEPTGDSGCPS